MCNESNNAFQIGNTISRKLFACINLLMKINNVKCSHTSYVDSLVNYSIESEDLVPLFTILLSWDHITRQYAILAIQCLFGHCPTIDVIREVGLTVEDILKMFIYILEVNSQNFYCNISA